MRLLALVFTFLLTLSVTPVLADQAKTVTTPAIQLAPDSGTIHTAVKFMEGLGLALGVFLIGIHFYKRRQNITVQSMRRLKLIERLAVGPKASLLLVEVDGGKVLVGSSADGITFHQIEAPKFSVFDEVDEVCKDALLSGESLPS